jgi:hypothetical protein
VQVSEKVHRRAAKYAEEAQRREREMSEMPQQEQDKFFGA